LFAAVLSSRRRRRRAPGRHRRGGASAQRQRRSGPGKAAAWPRGGAVYSRGPMVLSSAGRGRYCAWAVAALPSAPPPRLFATQRRGGARIFEHGGRWLSLSGRLHMRTIFVVKKGYRGCYNAQPSPRGADVFPGSSCNHDAAGVGLKRWRLVDWGRIWRKRWRGRREVVDHARGRWQDAAAKPLTRAITCRTPSFAPAVPHFQAPAVRFSALRVASKPQALNLLQPGPVLDPFGCEVQEACASLS